MQTSNTPTQSKFNDRVCPPTSSVCDLLADAEVYRRRGAFAEAIRLGDAALAVANRAKDADLIALAQLDLGDSHRNSGNPVEAIRLLHAAEHRYRAAASPLLARSLARQGLALADAGDQVRARSLYREALAIIESQGRHRDRLQEAMCYDALGVACTALDDVEQADNAYQRAIPLYGEIGNSRDICRVYLALALLRIHMLRRLRAEGGELFATAQLAEEALQFIELGAHLNTTKLHEPVLRADLCNARSEVLLEMGREIEALDAGGDALAAHREINSQHGQVETLTRLGETCLRLGRIDAALAHLAAAGQIGTEHLSADVERNLHRQLAEAHERNGEPARALEHFKLFHQLDIEICRHEALKKTQEFALRGEIENALAQENQLRERCTVRPEKTSDRRVREDALTGVANRRTFDEWLSRRPAPAARAHAVALLNIDQLAEINDRLSPAAGNAVLREAGRILRKQMRATDLVARYDSEEFVIVQAGISLARARETLERLREAFETHDWSKIDPALRVTVSIGVAAAEGNTTLTALTARADQLLHAAKNAGRTRVM